MFKWQEIPNPYNVIWMQWNHLTEIIIADKFKWREDQLPQFEKIFPCPWFTQQLYARKKTHMETSVPSHPPPPHVLKRNCCIKPAKQFSNTFSNRNYKKSSIMGMLRMCTSHTINTKQSLCHSDNPCTLVLYTIEHANIFQRTFHCYTCSEEPSNTLQIISARAVIRPDFTFKLAKQNIFFFPRGVKTEVGSTEYITLGEKKTSRKIK